MERTPRPSGGHTAGSDASRASPVVLRLLSAVHHPPARVLVPGCSAGHEVRALDARGYHVLGIDIAALLPTALDLPVEEGDFLATDWGGRFDLLCERGLYARLDDDERLRYVEAAARALRPGGQLFGVFYEGEVGSAPPYGTHPSALIHRFSPHFEVQRLEPSAFRSGLPGLGPLEVVLTRR